MADRNTKVTIDVVAQTVTFDVTGAGTYVFHDAKASEANRVRARFHGWKQRLVDDVAGEKDPMKKLAAIRKLGEWYEQGGNEWAQARAGFVRVFDSGAVIAAMARALFASDVDKANRMADAVAAKRSITREEALKLFAADERIAADMAKAKAASAPKVVDVDAELAAIEAELADAPKEPATEEPATIE